MRKLFCVVLLVIIPYKCFAGYVRSSDSWNLEPEEACEKFIESAFKNDETLVCPEENTEIKVKDIAPLSTEYAVVYSTREQSKAVAMKLFNLNKLRARLALNTSPDNTPLPMTGTADHVTSTRDETKNIRQDRFETVDERSDINRWSYESDEPLLPRDNDVINNIEENANAGSKEGTSSQGYLNKDQNVMEFPGKSNEETAGKTKTGWIQRFFNMEKNEENEETLIANMMKGMSESEMNAVELSFEDRFPFIVVQNGEEKVFRLKSITWTSEERSKFSENILHYSRFKYCTYYPQHVNVQLWCSKDAKLGDDLLIAMPVLAYVPGLFTLLTVSQASVKPAETLELFMDKLARNKDLKTHIETLNWLEHVFTAIAEGQTVVHTLEHKTEGHKHLLVTLKSCPIIRKSVIEIFCRNHNAESKNRIKFGIPFATTVKKMIKSNEEKK